MNGEMLQLARVTCYVNDSIKSGTLAPFKNSQYENDVVYIFANKKSFSDTENETITGTPEWVKEILIRGVKRAVFFVATDDDPRSAGFANAGRRGLITIAEDGQKSLWVPRWDFDRVRTMWNISYNEKKLGDIGNPPSYPDNYEDFKDVLERISVFAEEIGCKNWASVFRGALDILTGSQTITPPAWMKESFPNFDDKSVRMFFASSKADVFGGMGSWNDDPAGYASEKHRTDEYKQLSDELFKQTRNAVLFVVNR